MSKVIQAINKKLKIAAGRELSANQMVEAPLKTSNSLIYRINSAKGDAEDVIVRDTDGTFIREQISYKQMVTDDISYGGAIKHVGFYPVKTVQSVYDSQGKLTERLIHYGGIANPDSTEPRHHQFSPAGRWLGKKVRVPRLEKLVSS